MATEDIQQKKPTNTNQYKSVPKKIKRDARRVEHQSSLLTTNIDNYAMIPNKLMDEMLNPNNKRITQKYYIILGVFLRQSPEFHIKSSYLRARFDQRTLSKYIPMLIEDGWITRETKKTSAGSDYHVYHNNRLENVELYSDTPEYKKWAEECQNDETQEAEEEQGTKPNDHVCSSTRGENSTSLRRLSSKNTKLASYSSKQKHNDSKEQLSMSKDQSRSSPTMLQTKKTKALVKESLVEQYRRETGQDPSPKAKKPKIKVSPLEKQLVRFSSGFDAIALKNKLPQTSSSVPKHAFNDINQVCRGHFDENGESTYPDLLTFFRKLHNVTCKSFVMKYINTIIDMGGDQNPGIDYVLSLEYHDMVVEEMKKR
jgi:hypothetical protein